MRTTALLAAVAVFFYAHAAHPQEKPFLAGGNTVTLSTTGTTSVVQVQAGSSSPNLRVYNAGTVAAWILCGGAATVVTTTTGMPIAPGTVEVIGCGQTHVAGITAGTAATVYLTPGSGL